MDNLHDNSFLVVYTPQNVTVYTKATIKWHIRYAIVQLMRKFRNGINVTQNKFSPFKTNQTVYIFQLSQLNHYYNLLIYLFRNYKWG